jgi:hypothetical protein
LEYKVKERNSKMAITTKNNNELSSSTSSMSVNDKNNIISQNKSTEYGKFRFFSSSYRSDTLD